MGLVACLAALLAWARVQGLISADARVWRWLAAIGAAAVAVAALLGRRRRGLAAVEQVRDVIDTERAIEAERADVEADARAVTERAVEEAAAVRAAAQPSADLEAATDAMTNAFGDPQ